MRTIPLKESLNVEFKSDKNLLPDAELIDAVVGMTNAKGGTLFLGVEDDGKITGVHPKHADEIGVVALIANKTRPSITVQAELIREESHPVLRIQVPMSSKFVVASSDGKVLQRRLKLNGTPENSPIYPYEINSRLSELSLLDFSAQILPGAERSDFDPDERLKLRKIIQNRKGDQSLLELTDEELDKALRFVKEENGELKPTLTGMLILGKEEKIGELIPTAKSAFQVLEGTQVKVNEEFKKPLLTTFEIFENYLKAWNPEHEIEEGLYRRPIPEFSMTAFREGLVNAFCHRDYSVLQNVRLAINDEGMTISSPGGFIDGVNLNNLLTVEPNGRNQALADVFKRIGLAEKTGRGIDRIFEGSILYGRPWPSYTESTERYVKLFIQRAKPDIPFIRMLSHEESKLGHSLPINFLLILSALQGDQRMNIEQISDKTHIDPVRVKNNILSLMEDGLVEELGSGRSPVYRLDPKAYRESRSIPRQTRQKYVFQDKDLDAIHRLADKHQGFVSREEVMNALHISKDQAYRLLRNLTQQMKLKIIKKGRSTRYKVVK